MEHGLDTQAIAVVAGCFVLWGLISARSERINVTGPIAFVALGLLVAHEPLALIDVDLESATVQSIAELTLAVVLFSDASRVNVRALRADAAIPGRLLGVGLLLTIALGAGVAAVVFGGDLCVAALIGAAVAPTDAALGASILEDRRIPGRVRRVLNVESGLNDGIATPFVEFFIAGALGASGAGLGTALGDLGIGVLGGAVVGGVGGAALSYAWARGWGSRAFAPIAVLAVAFLSYAGAIELGGNGFVAAFVGGIAFGSVVHDNSSVMSFSEDTGGLLSLLVWFLFGAAMLVPALEDAQWTDVVFAVAALTIVRMIPVAIALVGSKLDRATVLLIGWFGPRGLASVVFALIAVDELGGDDGNRVLAAVTMTVLFSVVAHGVTAGPFGRRYGRRAERLHDQRPEHGRAEALRSRPTTPTRFARTRAEIE
jgi:sodium/hydrogen antiporter